MIIGVKGHFFKLTTTMTGIDLIWHNREMNKFCFWGPSYNSVIEAMNRIRSRIVKYTVYMTPPPALQQTNPPSTPMKLKQDDNNIMKSVEDISDDDDDDYYDMPELITHEEMLNENSKQKTFVDMSGGCLYNA